MTHFLRDTLLGQDDLIVNTDNSMGLTTPPDLTTLIESINGDLKDTNNDGFEVIYKVFVFFSNRSTEEKKLRFLFAFSGRFQEKSSSRT